jgi:polyisoprenoid-binding protein YceI
MKKLLLLLLIIGGSGLIFHAQAQMMAVNVDTGNSTVVWRGYKVLGEHHGNIDLKKGVLNIEDNKIVGGEFEMDMTSIDNSDLSGGSKDKLVGHLKSDDFFGVENHKTSKLVITKAVRKSAGDYRITGNLTIKGITHPVIFNATTEVEDNVTKANATIRVDRTMYDIKYGSGKFFDGLGDNMIKDNFQLEVSLHIGAALEL